MRVKGVTKLSPAQRSNQQSLQYLGNPFDCQASLWGLPTGNDQYGFLRYNAWLHNDEQPSRGCHTLDQGLPIPFYRSTSIPYPMRDDASAHPKTELDAILRREVRKRHHVA